MRRSHALVICVALLAVTSARALDAPAGFIVPELPDAVVDVRDIEPVQLSLPPQPDIVVRLETPETTASLASVPTPPAGAPASNPGEQDVASATPVPGQPLPTPADAPIAETVPVPAQADIQPFDIAPPDLPAIVADVPAAHDLAPLIAARITGAAAVARLPEQVRRELAQVYAERDHRPLWIGDHGWTQRGKGIVARLALAADDGLSVADYPVPAFQTGDAASLADADIRLSALAVLYARDARGARIDPRRLSRLITPRLAIPAPADVVGALSSAGDTDAVLAGFNPPHAGYRSLRQKLAQIRTDTESTVPSVAIPEGPALRVGMRDERIPLVRARLGLGPTQDPVFDRSVAVAVSDFQKAAGLPANGILGSQTLAALGSPAPSRLEMDILAQMERWRWLPAEMGREHIVVNIPEFVVRVVRDGEIIHQTRAIVGKPDTPTPIFSDTMDHVVVNPSWFVPPSILKNEFLPKLAADPDYAAKRGFEVVRRGNAISVRQPPGERNALGHIKFMFPNDHAVYLHDTPSRGLFNSTRRAFSHGCVRVDQPFRLAEQIMGRDAGWTEARVRGLVGGGERSIRLARTLPVHLTYMTHVVDGNGNLTTFEDIYGFHALVRTALTQLGRSARF